MSFWQESRVHQICLICSCIHTPCEFSKGDRYTKGCDKETPDYSNWHLCRNLSAGKCGEVEHAIYFTSMGRIKCAPGQYNIPSRPGGMLTESKKESTGSRLQLHSCPGSGWQMNKKGQDGHWSASRVGVSLVL